MDRGPVPGAGYDGVYARFDSALARRMRSAAYGRDVGQHSWASAEEIVADGELLRLSPDSRLLDLGCGAGGPLSLLAEASGCRGLGLEQSVPAVASARRRALDAGLDARLAFVVADLDAPFALTAASCTAALAIDVVLHLADRSATFAEVARVLRPGGRLRFTDAGVLTGPLSDAERDRRTLHGRTTLAPPGTNELALAAAGLRLLESGDCTARLIRQARGRLDARGALRTELESLEGAPAFARQALYLETVIGLAERGALTRWTYLAERPYQ